MDWKVYYGDDTTFSSEQGSPGDAPVWNVQTIVQPHMESGRIVLPPYDYYIWNGHRWWGVDAAGLSSWLVSLGLLRLNRDTYTKELLRGDEWVLVDHVDLILNLASMDIPVLFGQTIEREDYFKIMSLATNDPDFPVKTAVIPGLDWEPGKDESR